jgi:hypothetical protein
MEAIDVMSTRLKDCYVEHGAAGVTRLAYQWCSLIDRNMLSIDQRRFMALRILTNALKVAGLDDVVRLK